MSNSQANRAPTFFFIAWGCCLALFARLALGSMDALVRVVPDDAFYYLGIARNLSVKGLSSFDGGQTLTTGYHLLWAQLLAITSGLTGDDRTRFVRLAVVLSSTLALGAVLGAAGVARRRRNDALLIALTLALGSTSFLNNAPSALEWSLTLAMNVAFFGLLLADAPATPLRILAFVAVGTLGSLSRSDFGLVPAICAAVALLLIRLRGTRAFLWPSFATLLGALAGIGIVTLHNLRVSGSWVQGSARMKLMWGQSHGLNPLPFLKVLLQSIGYQPRAAAGWEQQLRLGTLMLALAALAAAGLVLGAVRITRKARTFESWSTWLSTLSDRELLMLLISPTIIAAYTLVYARNALAMQLWYSTHVTVPLVALTYFVVRAFLARFEPSTLATVALGVFGVHAALFVTTAPIYFWQTAALHDAGALQRVLPSAKVGLSDAGVTGFFHGQIINTDGLVNDEIADYAPDRLPCYLVAKGIAYFSGFGMSAERAFGLEPYDAYSDKFEWPRGAEDSPLTLYRVDPVRVAALPACASMRARAALGPSSGGVVDHP